MAKLISKTYGEALFELAVEEEKTELFMEEIKALLDIMKQNPDFSILMNHPKIAKEEKVQVIKKVFEGRISDELVAFFSLIIQKDRYREIEAILTYFLDRMKEFKGIGVAYVTTPLQLSDNEKDEVEKKLLETSKFQSMEMHYSIDEKLIGGMIIRIGDRVVDSSVQNKLNELQRDLMKIQLG